ncbi:MAG: MCE family protein [Acidobacteria bacterium]|nr:MCE family protein [Acidobacteriota bacterium]
MNRMRGALVGAFVLGGLLLFAAGLFLIGDRRLLFARQFELNTTFGKVTGLQTGTRVRVAGLDAGEVLEIALPASPAQKFRVRMRLRDDLRQLVRTDSVAAVQTDGIVGSAFIQVSVGGEELPLIEPGGTIAGTDPIEFADLIQEGRETFRTIAGEVVTARQDVSTALAALTETVHAANEVIGDVGDDVGRMTAASANLMEDVQRTAADFRLLVNGVKAGQGTLGQLVTDRALYDRMTGIGRETEETARNLRVATERARAALDGFLSPAGAAQQITQTLRNTLAEVQEVSSDLAESTEALKRNFLFRGFFRQRGFFDLDTISREAYQSGVLEGDERTALRIWIHEDVLFERSADGTEQLTAAGRRRLDSAMADLVRYPRDSPLVIEAYAEGREGEAAYVVSENRAQLVRDYLLARFRRQTTLTGVMPMSNLAPGSPQGDGRWSGIALSLFVRNEALVRADDGLRH